MDATSAGQQLLPPSQPLQTSKAGPQARIAKEVTYGSHMAVHMGTGLLFLGAGSLTLGTSNECIVALLAACFPRFPLDTTDNRYHLQALRHLYVLAVRPRADRSV